MELNEIAVKYSLSEDDLKHLEGNESSLNIIKRLIANSQDKTIQRDAKAYHSYRESPYLSKSARELNFTGIINRNFVVENEFQNRINELHGTMFYFKERTKELATISGLDADEMRMAFGEGIQNILEHGKSDTVEIEISVKNLNTENVFMEMNFKHYMPEKDFYSLKDADINADNGITDFESSRGRGEFLMREIMDERKFINGVQKKPDGEKLYFFKRSMRKYLNPKPKKVFKKLSDDFKNYIDSLQNYSTALFVRMDYFSGKKEIVISEETARSNDVIKVMKDHNYHFNGSDSYRNIVFSFWETEISNKKQETLDYVVTELEKFIGK